MRRFWQLLLVLHLALMPAMASPRPHDHATTEKPAPESGATGTAGAGPASSAGPNSSALELEIGELRELIAGQARQLQAQSEQLRQQQQAMELLAERLRIVS